MPPAQLQPLRAVGYSAAKFRSSKRGDVFGPRSQSPASIYSGTPSRGPTPLPDIPTSRGTSPANEPAARANPHALPPLHNLGSQHPASPPSDEAASLEAAGAGAKEVDLDGMLAMNQSSGAWSPNRRHRLTAALQTALELLHDAVLEPDEIELSRRCVEAIAEAEDHSGKGDPIRRGNRLVQKMWRTVMANKAAVAKSIAKHLVQLEPNFTAQHFHNINLELHCGRLLGMMTSGVQMLNKPDSLVPLVNELGVRHCIYGIHTAHFVPFLTVLVCAQKEVLGDDFTPVYEKEFRRVFALLDNLMLQGAESPQGRAASKRYDSRCAGMLKSSWQRVCELDAAARPDEKFIARWYAASGSHPLHRKMMARMAQRRDIVMDYVGRCLSMREDGRDDDTVAMLRDLGARHRGYGVTDRDYAFFGDHFLTAVREMVGGLPVHLEAMWREQWNFMANAMMSGANAGLASYSNSKAPREPPLTLIFTDVESSTRQWEADRGKMGMAIELHHRIIRRIIADTNGYEIKTVGDSFIVAYANVADAVLAAARIQVDLFVADWGEFSMCVPGRGGGPQDAWGPGLRVRVGVHYCTDVAPTFDPIHQRFDYYGPDVNTAARVETAACGGQVLMTARTWEVFQKTAAYSSPIQCSLSCSMARKRSTLNRVMSSHKSPAPSELEMEAAQKPSITTLGELLDMRVQERAAHLRGVSDALDLVSILPVDLSERTFPPPRDV